MTAPAHSQEPERFFYAGANCKLSALDYGKADKPAIIVLHGMRDHAFSMASLSEAFRARYRVVVPDLRGHGDSDNPGSYTMTQFVADLRALVLHLGLERPVLIGHSLGGHITSKYASIFARETHGLVLIDGMGPPRRPGPVLPEQQQEMWRSSIETALQLSSDRRAMQDNDEAFRRLTRNNPRLSTETAHMIIDHGTEPHPDGGVRWKWDPAVNMVWSTFDQGESELQWTRIECPVVVVTGDDAMAYWARHNLSDPDPGGLHERETTRRVKLFQRARHITIKGAGHMIHYDQPEALIACIDAFLAESCAVG